MLASGQLKFYMTLWGNLIKYSNQGWESLNSMVKTYFFRGTAKGIGCGKGHRIKINLVPIDKWLQRWIILLTTNTDKLFIKKMVQIVQMYQ